MKQLRFFSLFLLSAYLFSATEQTVDIYVTIPNVSGGGASSLNPTLEIGSFFTPNNKYYPLTPSEIKHNDTHQPIFSAKEAFAILHRASSLFGKVPRGKMLSLHLTLPEKRIPGEVNISISEKLSKQFELKPLDKKYKPIPIEVYLVDLRIPIKFQKPTKIELGKQYNFSRVEGKTLYVVIPNKNHISNETVNFNHYRLPLEVTYHSP